MERRDIEIFFPGGKKVGAKYKNHTIITDQPVFAGGENSAPSPFDLFLASIATCSGFYVLSFCQERGISVEDTQLVMKTERNPETKMIKKISVIIDLPAGFPDKYKKAVIKAVDSCTVKTHMLSPPEFEIETRTIS